MKKRPIYFFRPLVTLFFVLPAPTLFSIQCGKLISFLTTNTKNAIPRSFMRKGGAFWMSCLFLPVSFYLFRIPFLHSSPAFSPLIRSWSRLFLRCAVNLTFLSPPLRSDSAAAASFISCSPFLLTHRDFITGYKQAVLKQGLLKVYIAKYNEEVSVGLETKRYLNLWTEN